MTSTIGLWTFSTAKTEDESLGDELIKSFSLGFSWSWDESNGGSFGQSLGTLSVVSLDLLDEPVFDGEHKKNYRRNHRIICRFSYNFSLDFQSLDLI